MSKSFDMNKKKRLRKILEEAFNKDKTTRKDSSDIAFHMLDWIEDLEELYQLFVDIEEKNDNEIRDAIEGFLVHVPPHLNAARFLTGLGKVEDVFNLDLIEDRKK